MAQTRPSGETAASAIGQLLSGFYEGAKTRQALMPKQEKSSTPDIKDLILLGLAKQQGIPVPDIGQVAGYAQNNQVQHSQNFDYSGNFSQNVESLLNQKFGAGITSDLAATAGYKPSEQEKAALGVIADVAKEEATRPGKIQTASETITGTIPAKVSEQQALAAAKIGTETNQDTLRLLSSSRVLTDVFFSRMNDLYSKYKVKPGIGQGIVASIPGNEISQFEEAFRSASIENAAQTAAVSIPSSRAVRVVDVFKQSGPSKWSTLESGINNSAFTWQGAVSKDVLANPQDYGIDPNIVSDKSTLTAMANAIAKKSAEEFKTNFLKQAYMSNKNLFSDKNERDRIGNLVKEDTLSRLSQALGE